MMKQQDQARIIDAIQKASEAELKQLTLIRNALTGTKQPSSADRNNAASGMTVTRSLTRRSAGQNEVQPENSENTRKTPHSGKEPKRHKKSLIKNQNRTDKANSVRLTDWGNNKSTIKGFSKAQKRPEVANLVPFGGYGLKKDFNKALKRNYEAKKVSLNDTKKASAGGRDSSGRFTARSDSAAASAATQEKNARRAEQKQQQGFFRSLSRMLESATETNSDGMSSGVDIAGTAAGGPLWMMGKGMYDISAEVGKNVVTLKNFMQGKTEGNAALKIEPPLTHPPVTSEARTPPPIGKPKSADGFKSTQQAKAIQVHRHRHN